MDHKREKKWYSIWANTKRRDKTFEYNSAMTLFLKVRVTQWAKINLQSIHSMWCDLEINNLSCKAINPEKLSSGVARNRKKGSSHCLLSPHGFDHAVINPNLVWFLWHRWRRTATSPENSWRLLTGVQGLLQAPQSWVPLFKRCAYLLCQQVGYSLVAFEWQWIQPKEILPFRLLVILASAMHYLELHSSSWELAHIQPVWHLKRQSLHLFENTK